MRPYPLKSEEEKLLLNFQFASRGELIILLLVFLEILFCTVKVLAVDTKESTYLKSDSAICRRQGNENVCAYEGNASFVQGTTKLQAARITIYQISSKINKIVASGKHSHYSSTAQDNQKPLDAEADSITIYPDKNLMVLEGSGQVTSGPDKYSGPYIEYKFK